MKSWSEKKINLKNCDGNGTTAHLQDWHARGHQTAIGEQIAAVRGTQGNTGVPGNKMYNKKQNV